MKLFTFFMHVYHRFYLQICASFIRFILFTIIKDLLLFTTLDMLIIFARLKICETIIANGFFKRNTVVWLWALALHLCREKCPDYSITRISFVSVAFFTIIGPMSIWRECFRFSRNAFFMHFRITIYTSNVLRIIFKLTLPAIDHF